jgi:predicted ATPase
VGAIRAGRDNEPAVTIRTPDQRLRIFVSSTLEELAPERRAVREAIEGLHLTPILFELGARPHPPRALYRSYLEQSDVFVGVYWQRYGWVAPGESVSGLEDEYRLADNRPKLIYIKEPAPDREPRLAGLLADIRDGDQVSYRRFRDAAELRTLVADDLAVMLSERFGAIEEATDDASLAPLSERRLPQPLTRLIGRQADVLKVADALGDPSMRLVTLVGPGGVGKTRLALAVAERLREAYRDGVFFVPLAALAEPRLVVPTIAQTLGIGEGVGLSIGIRLRRALASAHCLIVLDNLERLTDAAPEIVDLLAATSAVQILATSRSVLNVGGERVLEVGPLELPTRGGQQTPAVELFLERIAAARPGFEPTADDRSAIEELTRRLDGLPLAIELAAARSRAVPPRMLLERLESGRLDLLTRGPRDLPARQRSLRETIAWSFDLLQPAERLLAERLSVFAGSADLDSVEAVADPAGELDVLGLLGSLVEVSLVRIVDDGSELRFGMLETVREFARERLEAGGEAELYRSRHAEHFVGVAAHGLSGLTGPDQLRWLGRFDRENDNLRAALRRAVGQGDAGTATRVGATLSWFWQMRSRYSEGRGWMRAVRELPGASTEDHARAWVIDAGLALWQGDFEVLEIGADEAVAALRDRGDRQSLGMALLLKGIGDAVAGRPAPSDAALIEASVLFDAEGDAFLRGMGLVGRSFAVRLAGRLDESNPLAELALDVSRSIGEWYIRSTASAELATQALSRNALPDVRAHAIEALVAAKKLRNTASAGFALEVWAGAELREGRLERAGRLYALAVSASGLAAVRPWRTQEIEHNEIVHGLRGALGPRLDELVAEARDLDLDAAVTELATTQPED